MNQTTGQTLEASSTVFPFKDPGVTDNGHLESCAMVLPGVIRRGEDVGKALKNFSTPLVVHGQRHSQGGQSLWRDGLSLDLELLQGVQVDENLDQDTATATVQAGATWDHLHQALNVQPQRRFAPVTHQSSPYFSIGGSLAVNCHGRDPRQGPLAMSVETLTLLLADGSTLSDVPAASSEGRLVLGGYGAGAIILQARLQLKPEHNLSLMLDADMTLSQYAQRAGILAAAGHSDRYHHYAFLKCAADNSLFSRAFSVEGVLDRRPFIPARVQKPGALESESLLTDDMLSVIYRRYRASQPAELGTAWNLLMDRMEEIHQEHRRELNAMRAPTRFSQALPDQWVDLMQEYFLPPEALEDFLLEARKRLVPAQVAGTLMLLTCTARVVQPDAVSLLNYAPATRISVVLNFKAPLAQARDFANAQQPLTKLLRGLIDLSLQRGGSYYLCYGRFASQQQFEQAYGPALQAFRQQRKALDPGHRFTNHFLRHYLGE